MTFNSYEEQSQHQSGKNYSCTTALTDEAGARYKSLCACVGILTFTVLSVILSLNYPNRLNDIFTKMYYGKAGSLELIYFIAPFVIIIFAVPLGVWLSFRDTYKQYLLYIILTTYICTIVNFACCHFNYYAMTNYDDILEEHAYYYRAGEEQAKHHQSTIALRSKNTLSLKGIDKFWTMKASSNRSSESVLAPPSDQELLQSYISLAHKRLPKTIQFKSECFWDIFWDCIYFSVTTICTVGYGDISPTNAVSKKIVDAEALIGQVLLVVAIGRVFARSWEKKE